MVQQTQALDTQAANAVAGLLNGQGVEIHDALIATQKASLAFELALQYAIRPWPPINRCLECSSRVETKRWRHI